MSLVGEPYDACSGGVVGLSLMTWTTLMIQPHWAKHRSALDRFTGNSMIYYSGPFEITADFFYLQNFCNFFLEFVHLPHKGSEA